MPPLLLSHSRSLCSAIDELAPCPPPSYEVEAVNNSRNSRSSPSPSSFPCSSSPETFVASSSSSEPPGNCSHRRRNRCSPPCCFAGEGTYCEELQGAINRFWWGQRGAERKIHWCCAQKLCKPKMHGGMGFKDLDLFNWALLGKQCWRLMEEENTLVSRVMKAKYYANSIILDTELGSRPSYLWRSIWESRWVVKKRMLWRVGDGESINVWKDPWIQTNKNYQVLSPPAGKDPSLVVADLLQGYEWNTTALNANFLSFEVERIKTIPISFSLSPDKLIWSWSTTGEYSVKSSYRGISGEESNQPTPGPSNQNKGVWNDLWTARMTPRVRMLAWSICSKAIPSNDRLHSRIPSHNPICPVCDREVEDDMHIFRDCVESRKVWKCLGIKIDKTSGEINEWMTNMKEGLRTDDFAKFLTTLSAIWDRRNAWIFKENFKETDLLASGVVGLLDEIGKRLEKIGTPTLKPTPGRDHVLDGSSSIRMPQSLTEKELDWGRVSGMTWDNHLEPALSNLRWSLTLWLLKLRQLLGD